MDYMFAAEKFVDALNAKFPDQKFEIDPGGRKYIRIVQGGSSHRYVHCFVERATGDVLKDAGWKGPAAGARGSLATPKDFQDVVLRADRYGGYLYR